MFSTIVRTENDLHFPSQLNFILKEKRKKKKAPSSAAVITSQKETE
jgi:hypothetical protein